MRSRPSGLAEELYVGGLTNTTNMEKVRSQSMGTHFLMVKEYLHHDASILHHNGGLHKIWDGLI